MDATTKPTGTFFPIFHDTLRQVGLIGCYVIYEAFENLQNVSVHYNITNKSPNRYTGHYIVTPESVTKSQSKQVFEFKEGQLDIATDTKSYFNVLKDSLSVIQTRLSMITLHFESFELPSFTLNGSTIKIEPKHSDTKTTSSVPADCLHHISKFITSYDDYVNFTESCQIGISNESSLSIENRKGFVSQLLTALFMRNPNIRSITMEITARSINNAVNNDTSRPFSLTYTFMEYKDRDASLLYKHVYHLSYTNVDILGLPSVHEYLGYADATGIDWNLPFRFTTLNDYYAEVPVDFHPTHDVLDIVKNYKEHLGALMNHAGPLLASITLIPGYESYNNISFEFKDGFSGGHLPDQRCRRIMLKNRPHKSVIS